MEIHLLPQVKGRLVLAIDKADQVWRREFRYDFFSMLRGWADNDKEIWSRLRLILAISSSPLFLIKDPHRSPFNLTDPIELEDLGDRQIRDLAEKYGLKWNDSELQKVKALVGGQPYLLRVLMFRAGLNTPLEQLLADDNLTKVFATYFDQYRAWLLEKPELSNELSRFKQLEPGETLAAANNEACHTLLRAGLLTEPRRDQYRLRYDLYKYLFD
jgi:hypothetical protein